MSATTSAIKVDLEKMRPVRPPGFSSPKGGVSYHDPKVQEVLASSYGKVFPRILEKDGEFCYHSVDELRRETTAVSKPVRNISDIPKGELLRLMEGWIKCRRLLQVEKMPNRIEAILLNFKVPNPRKSLECYRTYQDGDRTRLHILWGFESEDAPSVSVERALSILLDVPVSHMQSILSTSMPAPGELTSTVPVNLNLDTAAIASLAQQQLSAARPVKQRKSTYVIAALVGVILLGGGAALPSLLKGDSGESEVVEITPREERVAAREQREPDFVPAAVVEEVEEPSFEVAKGELDPVPAAPVAELPQEEAPLKMTGAGDKNEVRGDKLALDRMSGAAKGITADALQAVPPQATDALLDSMTQSPAPTDSSTETGELEMIINS